MATYVGKGQLMLMLMLLLTVSFWSSGDAFISQKYAFGSPNWMTPTSDSRYSSFSSQSGRSQPSLASLTLLRSSNDKDGDFCTPLDRPLLALVDVSALTAFAAVGKASHNSDGSLELTAVALTALPFWLAWLGTSPFTGVYKSTENKDNLIKATLQQVVVGWALAIPLGCVLRGFIKGYIPPIPFVVVTLVSTLIILSIARLVFAVAEDFFVELVN